MARKMVYGNDDNAYINHDGVVHETQPGTKDEGAILFRINGDQVWIPKKLIDDYDEDVVVVKKWWADKEGIGSDW